MKIFIIFILILAVSACQQNTAEPKQEIKPAETASATPQPKASVPKNVSPASCWQS